MSAYRIDRADLVRIVAEASAGRCAASTQARLAEVAETTDAVAAGWFHCEGVPCPTRQAGRRTNQRFQEAFDRAIAEHFGVALGGDGLPVPAIVVEVRK